MKIDGENAINHAEEVLLKWSPAYASFHEDMWVRLCHADDPIMQAFHHDAATIVLPYTTKYDAESWWYSGFVLWIQNWVYLRDSSIRIPLKWGNEKHHSYPKIVGGFLRPLREYKVAFGFGEKSCLDVFREGMFDSEDHIYLSLIHI